VIVFWRQTAVADVTRIIKYIAAENPIAARHVSQELLLAGDSLAVFPERGHSGRIKGTRELVAYPPYILVYRVSSQGDATILRVWHGAQSRVR
jgi:toxin ParE1/3/4